MNKYNQAAINHFLDAHNGSMLLVTLKNKYRNDIVSNYLSRTFSTHHMNYGQLLSRSYIRTDEINRQYRSTGQDVPGQVSCINGEFIAYMSQFINDQILGINNKHLSTPIQHGDGIVATGRSIVANAPQSRLCDTDTRGIDDPLGARTPHQQSFLREKSTGISHFRRERSGAASNSRANDVLDSQWYAHRPTQIRDDPVGEIVRARGGSVNAGSAYNTNTTDSINVNAAPAYNIGSQFSYQGGQHSVENGVTQNMHTGEDAEYTGNHVDRLLQTPYIQGLNSVEGFVPAGTVLTMAQRARQPTSYTDVRGYLEHPNPQDLKLWVDGDGFVDQTNLAAMQRLQNRRVFRSFNPKKTKADGTPGNGDTADEQIPFFERALYNRYYERDAEENVGGFETDTIVRGYGKDMNSLYCRVPAQKISCGNNNTTTATTTTISNISCENPHYNIASEDWAFTT